MAPRHTAAASSLSVSDISRTVFATHPARATRTATRGKRTSNGRTHQLQCVGANQPRQINCPRPVVYITHDCMSPVLWGQCTSQVERGVLARGAIKSVNYYNGLAGQSLYDKFHTAIVSSGKLLFCQKHEPFWRCAGTVRPVYSVCRFALHDPPHLAQISGRCLSHIYGVLRVASTRIRRRYRPALSHMSSCTLTGNFDQWRIMLRRLSSYTVGYNISTWPITTKSLGKREQTDPGFSQVPELVLEDSIYRDVNSTIKMLT